MSVGRVNKSSRLLSSSNNNNNCCSERRLSQDMWKRRLYFFPTLVFLGEAYKEVMNIDVCWTCYNKSTRLLSNNNNKNSYRPVLCTSYLEPLKVLRRLRNNSRWRFLWNNANWVKISRNKRAGRIFEIWFLKPVQSTSPYAIIVGFYNTHVACLSLINKSLFSITLRVQWRTGRSSRYHEVDKKEVSGAQWRHCSSGWGIVTIKCKKQ